MGKEDLKTNVQDQDKSENIEMIAKTASADNELNGN